LETFYLGKDFLDSRSNLSVFPGRRGLGFNGLRVLCRFFLFLAGGRLLQRNKIAGKAEHQRGYQPQAANTPLRIQHRIEPQTVVIS
jgi:hypothetical protein